MGWDVISVDFGQGVDTKTDQKKVVPGKWLRAQDVIFTAPNQARKRKGVKALSSTLISGGSLVAPQMLHNLNEDLLTADVGQLLAYSKTLSAWRTVGSYVSTDFSRRTIDGERPASWFADTAILNGYALQVWSTIPSSGNSFNPATTGAKIYASLVDLSTGTEVIGPTLLFTTLDNETWGCVRAVVLGGTTLAVTYAKVVGSPVSSFIAGRLITIGSGTASIGAEVVLSSLASINGNGIFEIIPTSTGAAISYVTESATYQAATVNTNFAVTHSATETGPGTGKTVTHLCLDSSTGNIWAYFPTASGINLVIYGPTLTRVLTSTLVASTASFGSASTMFVALPVDSTHQNLFVGGTVLWGIADAGNVNADATFQYQINSASIPGGGVTPTLFQNGVMPWSRPFTVTGNVGTQGGNPTSYAVFLYAGLPGTVFTQSNQQPTFFVVQVSGTAPPGASQYVAARFASGAATSLGAFSRYGAGGSLSVLLSAPNVPAISGATKFLFAYQEGTQLFNSPTWLDGGTLCSTFAATLDFSSARAYSAKNAGQLALLNGGVVHNYDGDTVSEWGFHLFPEITGLKQSNVMGAGLVAGETYFYQAIFQWIDNQGNLHESEPSEPVSIKISGANTAVTIYVTIPFMSQKKLVGVAIYRSPGVSSGQGAAYFKVSDAAFPLLPSGTNAYVSMVDGLTDAQLQTAQVPYTSPVSSVLPNTTPPPSLVMAPRGNRLWLVNAEQPTEEWYTKKFSPGIGLSPSGDLLNQIDPKLGEIVAVSEMDEKLVSFTSSNPFVQTGDGADDTGAGQTLTEPQPIPSDVGCDNHKSVIETPDGLMFHSPNGLYLLSRALTSAYMGMEVEAFNSQVLSAATRIPGVSQIRFLSTTGQTLVYDYIFKQWSTFTNYTGLGAVIWQNTYCYLKGAQVVQETTGWYLDINTAFAPLLQTSWIAVAQVQGFERVRGFELLGDIINGASANHGVTVSAAFNAGVDGSTFGTSFPFAPAAASTNQAFQYRDHLQQQKCGSVSLLIQEVTTGDSAEYIDFTNLSFEAKLKRGLRKVPTAAMVG